jgi:hypothetical protein
MKVSDMIRQIRACAPEMRVEWRSWQEGADWHAECRAGRPDGAFPIWGGLGRTREDAMREAVSSAYHYWLQVPHSQGISGFR